MMDKKHELEMMEVAEDYEMDAELFESDGVMTDEEAELLDMLEDLGF